MDAPTLLPTSVLAFVTTVHATLALLRRHRTPPGRSTMAILPSVLLALSPWALPTMLGVVAGFGAHLAWFMACEWLFPSPARATAAPATRAIAADAGGAPQRPRPVAAAPSKRDPFVPLSVLAVIDETPTIRTFRLRRPDGFDFDAGQFVTVRVQVDGKPQVRCYSISSAPEATGYLEISVKRQGVVSGTLHSTVRAGSTISARPPAGKFVYPARDDRPLVLVGGGVGITPLMSMLRHAIAAEPGRPVTLLYSARGQHELAFWDELRWIVSRHPHVRLGVTLTGPCEGWPGRRGRMDAAFLRDLVGEPAHSVFLICGPQEMITAVRSLATSLGVPAAQVRSEVFQAAAAIGAANSSDAARRGTAAARPTEASEMHLARCDRRVSVARGQTLLEAAESAGVPMESLCRSGVCGTCRARLLGGDVHCTSDALGDHERAEGWVLPCVTWAKSDVTLDV